MDYNEGWNAWISGIPMDPKKSEIWKDGWTDAEDVYKTYGIIPKLA